MKEILATAVIIPAAFILGYTGAAILHAFGL